MSQKNFLVEIAKALNEGFEVKIRPVTYFGKTVDIEFTVTHVPKLGDPIAEAKSERYTVTAEQIHRAGPETAWGSVIESCTLKLKRRVGRG